MSPKVVLRYFPLRGRGELIRMILQIGEIPYDEEIIQFQDWAKEKPGEWRLTDVSSSLLDAGALY